MPERERDREIARDTEKDIEIITRVCFGYRQYHVLGIKSVLCEPLASIIHYFFIPNT